MFGVWATRGIHDELIISGRWLTSCFCIQRHAGFMLHTFMTTQPFKLHFAVTEQYFLRPPGLLSVTFMIRHQFQIHCILSVVLIHLTMANLLLSIHRFSTNDCRGSGDVFVLVDSLAEAFVCIHLGTAFPSLLRHARGQYFDL